MDDHRIIEFERALWVGEAEVYRRCVSPDCLMVVPEQPFLLRGEDAILTVERTPRWSAVEFDNFEIKRPQEGLIIVGYRVSAGREGERYDAYCTSTYQRVSDHDWRVVQHQQTLSPPGIAGTSSGDNGDVQEEAAKERENNRGYQ